MRAQQFLFVKLFPDLFLRPCCVRVTDIGVNAAGVAVVATPQIFDLQGSSCVDDAPIFWQVFYFFPFNGTWHTNLKNNTPRMHHITPFSDEKFIHKFAGKGHSLDSPRFSHLRRSACDQWCIGGVYAGIRRIPTSGFFLTAYTYFSDRLRIPTSIFSNTPLLGSQLDRCGRDKWVCTVRRLA